MRFKCVCKPWRDLIGVASHFIRTQIHRAIERGNDDDRPLTLFAILNNIDTASATSSSTSHGNYSKGRIALLSHEPAGFYETENTSITTFLDLCFDDFKLVGSCNGIACLVRTSQVWLLNPYTTEYKIFEFGREFVFDDYGRITYSFCFDLEEEDYKLVCFIHHEWDAEINIYSLNHISCSTISNIGYSLTLANQIYKEKGANETGSGVFLNGALHWLTFKSQIGPEESILCFNLKEKHVQELDTPFEIYVQHRSNRGDLGSHFDVWVMTKYGLSDSWIKLFVIEQKGMPYEVSVVAYMRPLGFAGNDKLLFKDGKNLILYDPKQKTAKFFNIHGISDRYLRKDCYRSSRGRPNIGHNHVLKVGWHKWT
ncbi:hypothetical protein AQUCO_08900024v1 [Aquilegia coerulea]|uniref:F-box associated beta-propeller type 1 domain-containing protein n=1 Tax=Aquilegia coerulea TaxID=218851 RepID=A0A2G5C660_AQUCA|nr:hypothetical protein AQUCO_08900024v1 [Aquilegia coerulea]